MEHSYQHWRSKPLMRCVGQDACLLALIVMTYGSLLWGYSGYTATEWLP